MNNISFAKAPLLEIVAELRWLSKITLVPPSGTDSQIQPSIVFSGASEEEFFDKLGSELYARQFQKSERLIPAGFPAIANQPIFRYRNENEKSVLYQAGPGVFSIHGTPPYRSWKEFSPFVARGAEALIASRAGIKEESVFTQATLRYIDLFDESLTEGRSPEAFISGVLGISARLPENLVKMSSSTEAQSLIVKVVLPLKIGTLSVSVGDGAANNRRGFVLDTAVASTSPTPFDLGAIMSFFNNAHEYTNGTFIELTKSIRDLMEPREA
jgi:uncharacterized protein (TIGR04255 family)